MPSFIKPIDFLTNSMPILLLLQLSKSDQQVNSLEVSRIYNNLICKKLVRLLLTTITVESVLRKFEAACILILLILKIYIKVGGL